MPESSPIEDKLLPIDLIVRNGKPHLVLCRVGPIRFDEPFFIDTLIKLSIIRPLDPTTVSEAQSVWKRALNIDLDDPRIVIADLDHAAVLANRGPQCSPAHFIFHMSKCGSTLVTRLLRCLETNLVLSEPTAIDAVLDPALDRLPLEERIAWLRAIVTLLGQPFRGRERQLFVKFRSWNVLQLAIVRQAFPATPWTFMHRHGLEVLMSLMAEPPAWLHAKAADIGAVEAWLGASQRDIQWMRLDEYAARWLGAFCRAALDELANGGGAALDYATLVANVPWLLKKHFQVPWSNDVEQFVSRNARYHSKDPAKSAEFQSDSSSKRAAAQPAQRRFADDWVESVRPKLVPWNVIPPG